MKVLMGTVTLSLLDPLVLDELFKTESWQTLMTFTRESARKCNTQPLSVVSLICVILHSISAVHVCTWPVIVTYGRRHTTRSV